MPQYQEAKHRREERERLKRGEQKRRLDAKASEVGDSASKLAALRAMLEERLWEPGLQNSARHTIEDMLGDIQSVEQRIILDIEHLEQKVQRWAQAGRSR
jgi:hypothetical protein